MSIKASLDKLLKPGIEIKHCKCFFSIEVPKRQRQTNSHCCIVAGVSTHAYDADALSGSPVEVIRIVPAALVINALAWPLALVVTYRIGQVTGVEYLHSIRARPSARQAARATRKSVG
jgi:hypothetical protein